MSKEAIERTILNFHPGQTVRRWGRIDLGSVGQGINIFYGHVTYEMRAGGERGEVLIGKMTTQPVVALERKIRDIDKPTIIALAYATDIRALPQGLAEKVAAQLNKQRPFDCLYEELRLNPRLPERVSGEWELG